MESNDSTTDPTSFRDLVESNDPTTRSRQIPPDPTRSHHIPPYPTISNQYHELKKVFIKKCAYVIIVTSGLYAAVAQVPIQLPTQVGVNAGADAGAGKDCCHCLPARTEVC
jgi:hypothetical protein